MTKYCLVRVTPCWFHQFLYLYRLLYCVLWKLWIFILTLVFTKISWKQRFTFTIYICAAPKGLISRNILGKREFLVFSHVLTLHIYCTLNFVFQFNFKALFHGMNWFTLWAIFTKCFTVSGIFNFSTLCIDNSTYFLRHHVMVQNTHPKLRRSTQSRQCC